MKKIIRILVIVGFSVISLTMLSGAFKTNYSKNDLHIESLLLVNKENGVLKGYTPENLAVPNIRFNKSADEEERMVSDIIIKPLEKMFSEASKEGITLLGNSGYRSYERQKQVYYGRIKSEGIEAAKSYVAKPGYSEHQTGLAMDITNEGKYFVKGTVEADWLQENCYKYGFIIRYPEGKKHITGFEYEPWHVRYVGNEVAEKIHNEKLTLEEYIERQRVK